jgi:hypothetical protein
MLIAASPIALPGLASIWVIIFALLALFIGALFFGRNKEAESK